MQLLDGYSYFKDLSKGANCSQSTFIGDVSQYLITDKRESSKDRYESGRMSFSSEIPNGQLIFLPVCPSLYWRGKYLLRSNNSHHSIP